MDSKPNISLFKVFMSDEAVEACTETLKSGMLTQGPRVEEFEKDLKTYLDHPYVATLNSATAGLTLALRLLMKPDPSFNWKGFNRDTDKILCPALTCMATTCSILANHVNIQWLDTASNSTNIDLDTLAEKLTPHTKVIYLVHWGGIPVDLDRLDKILTEEAPRLGFKPMVVEDCAHAFGTKFGGKRLSNHGNICVYSLQAIKQLSTSDGGLITLPNKSLYKRTKLLRWYGIDRNKRNYKSKDFRLENDIAEYGYKFHMNDVNASLGIHNLKYIDANNAKSVSNAKYYDENLKNIPNLRLMHVPPSAEPAYWLYTIFVRSDDPKTDIRKQAFMKHMQNAGVMTSQVHNRNDINSCVAHFSNTPLPNLDLLENQIVCIPVGWWVTHTDRAYIVEQIKSFFES